MVGRIMVPHPNTMNVRCPHPNPCEYTVTLHGKKNFADVIKALELDYPGLSR